MDMRPARLAFAISLALHGVALAWFEAREPPNHPAPRAVTVQAPAEPTPVDVVLLDEHAPGAAITRDGAGVSQGTRPALAVSVPSRRSEATERKPAEVPKAPRSKYMTMRAPEIDHGPSQEYIDDFLSRSRPVPPKATEHEQNEDALARDHETLDNPGWVEHASPDEVTDARLARMGHRQARAEEELHPDGHGMKSDHETFSAHVDRDGTAHLQTAPDVDVHPSCLFAGCKMAFDDALMRRAGIDPYAAAKRQWLEKTFDERAAIGLANRKDDLAHSAEYMQRNLAWMWGKTRDPAERKQALFELWDDCAESGDDDLVRGGQAARDYLDGFVRSHLPEGSPDAFTADELARLNAHRHSSAVFAPYAER